MFCTLAKMMIIMDDPLRLSELKQSATEYMNGGASLRSLGNQGHPKAAAAQGQGRSRSWINSRMIR